MNWRKKMKTKNEDFLDELSSMLTYYTFCGTFKDLISSMDSSVY